VPCYQPRLDNGIVTSRCLGTAWRRTPQAKAWAAPSQISLFADYTHAQRRARVNQLIRCLETRRKLWL